MLACMQESRRIGVLLMDKSGSVGLDLSFVPHVFLMEPFLDAALEEQVVARAHRMGARSKVTVEMLVMKVPCAGCMLPQLDTTCCPVQIPLDPYTPNKRLQHSPAQIWVSAGSI